MSYFHPLDQLHRSLAMAVGLLIELHVLADVATVITSKNTTGEDLHM